MFASRVPRPLRRVRVVLGSLGPGWTGHGGYSYRFQGQTEKSRKEILLTIGENDGVWTPQGTPRPILPNGGPNCGEFFLCTPLTPRSLVSWPVQARTGHSRSSSTTEAKPHSQNAAQEPSEPNQGSFVGHLIERAKFHKIQASDIKTGPSYANSTVLVPGTWAGKVVRGIICT